MAIAPFTATTLFAWSKTGLEIGAGPARAQAVWIILGILCKSTSRFYGKITDCRYQCVACISFVHSLILTEPETDWRDNATDEE